MPPMIQALLDDLQPFGLWWEMASLALSFALAVTVASRFRKAYPGSFLSTAMVLPAVASVAVFSSTYWLERHEPVPLLHILQVVLLTWLAVRASSGLLLHIFPQSKVLRLIASVGKWIIWIAGVMAVLGLMTPCLQWLEQTQLPLGKSPVSLWDIAEAVMAAAVTLISALWLSAWFEARLMKAESIDMNHRLVLSKLMRAAMLLVAVLIAMSFAGIPLTVLGVFSGALGVGLGLGLQRLASNYLSGFVILLDGSIKVNDNIRVDGFDGQVTAIRTRYTLVKAPNGRECIVPNETLVTHRVENLSLANPNLLLTQILSCAYESDVDRALVLCSEATLKQPRVLREPAPHACISAFAADGLEITLAYWIADPENGQLTLKGDIFKEIWAQFKQAKIEVPYPQRVVRQI